MWTGIDKASLDLIGYDLGLARSRGQARRPRRDLVRNGARALQTDSRIRSPIGAAADCAALRIRGVPYPIPNSGSAVIQGLTLEPDQNQIHVDFVAASFASGESLP